MDQTFGYCYLLKITRVDTTEIGLTDLDVDVLYNGLNYLSDAGHGMSNISSDDQLSVNNFDIVSLLAVAGVTRADIAAGLYDGARIDCYLYDWQAQSLVRQVGAGHWGEVTRYHGSGRYVAEFRSLSQKLQQPKGEVISPACLAELGDARCKIDLGPLTVAGSVDSSADPRHFVDAGLTQAATHFDGGQVVWTTGANSGFKMKVKSFTLGGNVELFLPMQNPISNGDTFTIRPGCDKTLATCRDVYANTDNRRAHDFTPGDRAMTKRTGL